MSRQKPEGIDGDTGSSTGAFRIVRKSQNVGTADAGNAPTYVTFSHVSDEPLYNLQCLLAINDTDEVGAAHLRVIRSWHIPGMFPNDTETLFVRYSYEELMKAAEDGKLEFIVSNLEEKIAYVFSLADFGEFESENVTGTSGSSGGCDGGLAGAGVLIALAFAVMKKR